MSVDTPHFDYPFRIGSDNHVAVVEQDSPDEIVNGVVAILKTPSGFRLDVPAFGCKELLFISDKERVAAIADALNIWEPRAEYIISSQPDLLDKLIAEVTIGVQGRSDA